MAVPSNPGWKFGYVPSPGEWNNTFAGKADFPVPVNQGGTGAQDAASGNYNLQQRAEIITPTLALTPLTFYSVRTDLTATTDTLPPANTCRAGDWIYMFDSGANAAANNVTLQASGTDVIRSGESTVTALLMQTSGFQLILTTDGVGTWRAGVAGSGSGGGGQAAAPIPIQIGATFYHLQLSDAGQYLQFTSDTAVQVTLPAHADVSFILGSVTVIEQFGLGKVTVVPGPGVTINARNGTGTAGQFGVIQIKNGSLRSADVWTLLGDATDGAAQLPDPVPEPEDPEDE